MFANNVSTRKVERMAKAMGIECISSSRVSRICESLDEAVVRMREGISRKSPSPTYGPTPPTSSAAKADARYRQRWSRRSARDPTANAGSSAWMPSTPRPTRVGRDSSSSCTNTASQASSAPRATPMRDSGAPSKRPSPGSARQRCIVRPMRNATGCASTRQKRGAVLAS